MEMSDSPSLNPRHRAMLTFQVISETRSSACVSDNRCTLSHSRCKILVCCEDGGALSGTGCPVFLVLRAACSANCSGESSNVLLDGIGCSLSVAILRRVVAN